MSPVLRFQGDAARDRSTQLADAVVEDLLQLLAAGPGPSRLAALPQTFGR